MSKHVFGPVPSRRLGRSLGVDPVPMKTCSFDCVYCQLGPTTCKTVERREWVPLNDLVAEVEARLDAQPDYITLGGSGEPTLHARLGELIAAIQRRTEVPVAVLTNGSLLWDEQVRRGLDAADLAIPSLDAGDEEHFQWINRPHPSLSFQRVLEGLIALGREFRGEVWLEVFLTAETATEARMARLRDCAARIAPDRVQLNTVTRPPSESDATPVPADRLRQIAATFPGRAESIAEFRATEERTLASADREAVLGLLARRPCTPRDIAAGLGLHHGEVIKLLEALTAAGRVEATCAGRGTYYRPVDPR